MGHRARTKTGWNAREQALLDAVGAIYDAALSPELWPAALSKVSHVCGSSWTLCSITPLDPMAPGTTFQNAEADPEIIARMARFTTPENNPSVPRLLAAPLGSIIRREEHFSDAEWERTEIHNELYRPRGIYAAIGTPLIRSQYFVPFGVHRNRSRGGFERAHLKALSHIIPHMQRAIQITLRLNTLAAHSNALEDAWDRLACGLFVLDGNGRILWANRAGERTLANQDGLSGYDGSLLAATNEANAKLRQLIGEAARTANGDGLCHGGAILVPRRPPAQPLPLVVSPLRAESASRTAAGIAPNGGVPAVLVFVNDPDLNPKIPGALLQKLYRLTEREARLAVLLLEGLDLREIGQRMDVSIHTVRTHLRHLFDKTNTRRQAQLIRVLSGNLSIFGSA
jgi:DNA-binding CsgD family transcriptional regulator/PAS domain-containing protein